MQLPPSHLPCQTRLKERGTEKAVSHTLSYPSTFHLIQIKETQ